ncbi:MAG: succinylglutamate desuccinylase/aspartoacylase family protein, partial [Aggregatilineales bacterium]
CCHMLDADLDPAQMRGSLVLIPVLNVPAFEAAERGNPLDTFSYDLNRIYPGREKGYLTERLAYTHSEIMREVADFEIGIHSGGAHSYLSETIFTTTQPEAIELAKAMGADWSLILKNIRPSGNPGAVMFDAGKYSLTVELGGRPNLFPAEFHRAGRVLADGILNLMRYYNMIDGEATMAETWYTGVQHALLAPVSGMYVANPALQFQQFMKKGDNIAKIVDVYGETLAELTAPVDGMIFGLRALPNVQTGEWCCFYAEIEGEL